MAEKPLDLLEMEKELKKDGAGVYRKHVLERLMVILGNVRGSIDTGLAPEEYEKTLKLKEAVEASQDVVEKVWKGIHG